MENIVDEIIRIDKEADDRLAKAEEQGREIIISSEKEASELTVKLRADAEKRISQVFEFHKNETDSAINRISQECSDKIREIDEAYEKKHKDIEDSIFKSIVGGGLD